MIEKLKIPKTINWDDTSDSYFKRHFLINNAYEKINELVDVINELQVAKDVMFNRIDMLNNAICDMRNATENTIIPKTENVQQVSYMAPGDTTVFYGAGCSVEFDTPLPEGTRITIKSITKEE